MKHLSVSIEAKIEPIIDGSSLAIVLSAIAQVCNEKSLHILENWQDSNTAKVWRQAAIQIERLSDKVGC